MQVRLAELAEIPQLNEVEADAGRAFLGLSDFAFVADYPLPDEEAYVPFIRERRAFVCDDGGRILGFVLMGEVDGRGHVFQVSVRSGFQRRGLGRQLLVRGEDWARSRGLREVSLTTFRDVPWNGPAYARLGYSPVPDGMTGRELAAILAHERAIGLFRQARVAMFKRL